MPCPIPGHRRRCSVHTGGISECMIVGVSWWSDRMARPKLFYIRAFLGWFGERERFSDWCLEMLLSFGGISMALPTPPFHPVSCRGSSRSHSSFLPAQGETMSRVFRTTWGLSSKWSCLWHLTNDRFLFSFCLRVKRVGRSVFISPHGHFLPPTLLPSYARNQWVHTVTSTRSDTILEAFVCSFP